MVARPRHRRRLLDAAPLPRRRSSCRPALEALEDRSLPSTGYILTSLASDVPGVAPVTDPNLVNPWGISVGPIGPFWLSDNGTGVSDLLTGGGQVQTVPVTVAGPRGARGTPTGTVFNDGPGFAISQNGVSAPSQFLFASTDGTISGWSPHVNLTAAVIAVDDSGAGAAYTGLATASDSQGHALLYAANVAAGTVDVLNANFQPVQTAGGFQDPNRPAGYAPFGIQAQNGRVYVTYIPQGNPTAGAGLGFVDVFSADGALEQHISGAGQFSFPWGLALAPANFGPFSGDLLVGNVGDGHINAFDPFSGSFQGALTGPSGTPLAIDMLWGLSFGNDHGAGASDTLYFTGGSDHEQHGLFGQIRPAAAGPADPASLAAFTPSASDDYPLPPAVGPSLPAEGVVRASTGPVLLPLSGSTLALAPTLSAPAADPVIAASVVTGLGNAVVLANHTAAEFSPGILLGSGASRLSAGPVRDAATGLQPALGSNVPSAAAGTGGGVSPRTESNLERDTVPSSELSPVTRLDSPAGLSALLDLNPGLSPEATPVPRESVTVGGPKGFGPRGGAEVQADKVGGEGDSQTGPVAGAGVAQGPEEGYRPPQSTHWSWLRNLSLTVGLALLWGYFSPARPRRSGAGFHGRPCADCQLPGLPGQPTRRAKSRNSSPLRSETAHPFSSPAVQ
jgi:uncharacterized protein (TIGR03118 family)